MFKNILKYIVISSIMLFMFGLYGCRSTKYVANDEQLLNRVQIKTSSSKDISKSELKSYLRQDANHRILGTFRFYLGIYNLSGKNENNKVYKWLRRMGEAPVIYDSTLVERSAEQMTLYLQNQGYFLANVKDTTKSKRKKAKVIYTINPGPRYRLNNLYYQIEDSAVKPFIMADTMRTILRKNRGFVLNTHNRERERIARRLQNQGFYNFSKEYIYFIADSTIGNYQINDTLVLVSPSDQVPGRDENGNHARYKINNVNFQVGEDFRLDDDVDYFSKFDTINYAGNNIIFKGKPFLRPNVLTNSSYINAGDYYQIDLVDKTQSLLSGLRLFKFINIQFEELENKKDSSGNHLLDCYINLAPTTFQSVAFALEGTNSSGNLGAAGNINYQHKNIFKGAELFTLNTRLSRQNQFINRGSFTERFNTFEVGGETSVVFPSFIIPFKIERFRQKYNPKTSIALSYNYQERPDYTRTIASSRFGYVWKSGSYRSHSFFPIDFNLVKIPYVDERFKEIIDQTFLKHTYEDHLILNLNYSLLFNQQETGRRFRPFWYLRYTAESGGNMIDLLSPLWTDKSEEGYGDLFGVRYAQYVKSDIDLRYHKPLSRRTSMTYRMFAGVGLPYGNLDVLPFEKRYFSGGANSVRAWPVRALGPGSFKDIDAYFYNQTADIKLEANIEYRFRLFWILEGAFFLDAGNIWNIRPNVSLDGGLFEWDKFYKQFAVGTGFGTRFDFNFFIFRIDTGLKLHDPTLNEGNRWIPLNRGFVRNDVAFNFAIGYPF